MIGKRTQRLFRHRVDYVGTDQLRHVEHVGVAGVLGAGARPGWPLRTGAEPYELLPIRAAEFAAVALVGDAGTGERHLSAQRRVRVELGVDLRVNSGQEERRHGGNLAEGLTGLGAGAEPA